MAQLTSADLATSMLDLDKDGKISRKDFELIVDKNDYPNKADNDKLRQAINTMCDVIGLGPGVALSYEEYAARVRQVLSDPTVEKAIRAVLDAYFDCLDKDKNGFISLKEYEVFYSGLGKAVDPSEVKTAFDSLDKNKNGKIERQEFVDFAYEFFYTTENKHGAENMAGARCCCCRCCCCPCCCCCCRRW